MRILKKKLLLLLLLPSITWADSPITSTVFHGSYKDFPLVVAAKKSGVLNSTMSRFLANKHADIGVKAALINALSWSIKGKTNALKFRAFLASKYNTSGPRLVLARLTSAELMSLGYLTVMDNYFKPQEAEPILALAAKKNPRSLTIAMVHALVKAQMSVESDWCQIWFVADRVVSNRELQPDLRKSAVDQIMSYMNLYKKYCQ